MTIDDCDRHVDYFRDYFAWDSFSVFSGEDKKISLIFINTNPSSFPNNISPLIRAKFLAQPLFPPSK